jgi:peroxiredoxin (alkyl hydroperoxide reductase subunit C)
MDKKAGGIKGITYPFVADTNKTISYNYVTLNGSYDGSEDEMMLTTSEMIAYRGLF